MSNDLTSEMIDRLLDGVPAFPLYSHVGRDAQDIDGSQLEALVGDLLQPEFEYRNFASNKIDKMCN